MNVNGFKTWVIDLFKDERDSTSIKPVIAIIGAIFLCGSLVVSFFVKGNTYQLSDTLINSILIMTGVGMGADTLDKFSFKGKPLTPPTE